MRAWRNKSLKTHEFGPWKFENSTLADKLKVQRHLRDVNEQLREAPESHFLHDIWGIHKNLNRHTGKLENLFIPRCAE